MRRSKAESLTERPAQYQVRHMVAKLQRFNPFSRRRTEPEPEPVLDEHTLANIDRAAHDWGIQYRSPMAEVAARRLLTEAAYALRRDREKTATTWQPQQRIDPELFMRNGGR
jgi:hypothetical protein